MKNKMEQLSPYFITVKPKLFEKTMHSRIYAYFEDAKLFYDLQYDFRKKHSANHTILNIIGQIKENLDNKT